MSSTFTKCPNCGVGIEPDIETCQSCKSPIPPVSYGLVVCSICNKIVSDTRYCLYCGAKVTYNLTERERSILGTIVKKGMYVTSTVSEIHKRIDGSKESIRTNLTKLYNDRLVTRPRRGVYRIADKGLRALQEDKMVLTPHVSEFATAKVATIFKPQLGTKLLRDRANELNISYLRIESDVPGKFVSILEHIANKITERVVELADGEEVLLEHMEQAIRELVPVQEEK